jgi:hypothetical protein
VRLGVPRAERLAQRVQTPRGEVLAALARREALDVLGARGDCP